jgi:hypothetical protein
MDPLDRANVRVEDSRIAGVPGVGLFARRDIPAFSVVVYYAGVLVPFSGEFYDHNLRL